MNQMSRTEINIRRLLGRCELIAKEDAHNNWRLEKYIFALENMVKELQMMSNKPCKDTMLEYMRRIDFLKGLVDTAKLSNPVERVVATQMLSKSPMTTTNSIGPNITTQIHQKTTAKYNRELRSELFNIDKGSSEDGLRQRLPNSNMQNEDIDAFLKYNRNIQEKIAENMLLMTSNMKEHALTASAIIKKDIGFLEKSNQLTDVNATKLKTESLKLEEHTKSNWRCWVWLMVAFVLVVFFNMVLFIKVAKKRV